MIRRIRGGAWLVLLIAAPPAAPEGHRYSVDERIQLTRDLTAEYATSKVSIPRSKKPLPLDAASGELDVEFWTDAQREHGPAARMGDLVQITKMRIEDKRIIFDLNGGFKGGRKWYERIQVGGGMGGGGTMTPVGRSGQINARPAGTTIALNYPDGVPELDARQIKELLKPVLDFEKRTATEQYVDSLPEPQKAAIEEKRAIEGMDQDGVLLAMGRPVRKVRETEDGVEYEDWVYGTPPGKVVFVTFKGTKVIRVREAYGGLGGTTAPPLPVQ